MWVQVCRDVEGILRDIDRMSKGLQQGITVVRLAGVLKESLSLWPEV